MTPEDVRMPIHLCIRKTGVPTRHHNNRLNTQLKEYRNQIDELCNGVVV